MSDVGLEQRLIEAFGDARATVEENADLFARVTRSLEEAVARRRWRWRMAGWLALFILANTALALAFSDFDNRRFNMRFGRSYAADVFRANPRTGKSYLVLTDVAYYLIFTSFVLFTVTFVEHKDWHGSTGTQLKAEVARVGGILLIMGVLHAANVVALPIIGRLLSSNKRLDEGTGDRPSGTVPPLGAGTWLLRIEPSPGSEGHDAETASSAE
jgi:hypothetical protein